MKRYSIEILADNLKMLGRRSDNPSAGQPLSPQGGQQGYGSSSQQQYGGGYGQSGNSYSGGGYQSQQPVQTPAAPEVNLDDPDDLPF